MIKRLENLQFASDEDIRKRLLPDVPVGTGEWVDISGLIAPKSEIERLMEDVESGRLKSMEEIHARFVEMHKLYYTY